MSVLPLSDAQAISSHLVGNRAIVPAKDEYNPVGLLDPALANSDSELSIAALGFLLHGHFDKLYPGFLFCSDPFDYLRCLFSILSQVSAGAADHDLYLLYYRLQHCAPLPFAKVKTLDNKIVM